MPGKCLCVFRDRFPDLVRFNYFLGVRLVGSSSSRKGLVQVYYNKTWGWVCADQWDKNDADVACRMMGFNGSLSGSVKIQNRKGTEIPPLISRVQCIGNETSLLACTHEKQRSLQSCENSTIASAMCKENQGD